jgi:Flp pilus assembly pilin Flp
MYRLLSRLWLDNRGAVISTELILLIAIVIFGLIPAFVAMRNSVIASMGTIGNTLSSLVPNFTFSGFAIGGRTIGLHAPGGKHLVIANSCAACFCGRQLPPIR